MNGVVMLNYKKDGAISAVWYHEPEGFFYKTLLTTAGY